MAVQRPLRITRRLSSVCQRMQTCRITRITAPAAAPQTNLGMAVADPALALAMGTKTAKVAAEANGVAKQAAVDGAQYVVSE